MKLCLEIFFMRMCIEKNSLGNPKQTMTEQNKNNNTPTN